MRHSLSVLVNAVRGRLGGVVVPSGPAITGYSFDSGAKTLSYTLSETGTEYWVAYPAGGADPFAGLTLPEKQALIKAGTGFTYKGSSAVTLGVVSDTLNVLVPAGDWLFALVVETASGFTNVVGHAFTEAVAWVWNSGHVNANINVGSTRTINLPTNLAPGDRIELVTNATPGTFVVEDNLLNPISPLFDDTANETTNAYRAHVYEVIVGAVPPTTLRIRNISAGAVNISSNVLIARPKVGAPATVVERLTTMTGSGASRTLTYGVNLGDLPAICPALNNLQIVSVSDPTYSISASLLDASAAARSAQLVYGPQAPATAASKALVINFNSSMTNPTNVNFKLIRIGV